VWNERMEDKVKIPTRQTRVWGTHEGATSTRGTRLAPKGLQSTQIREVARA